MKVQFQRNFYSAEGIMYEALNENNVRPVYDLPDGTPVPSTATIFDEVPVQQTRLVKKEPDTLSEMTNATPVKNK